MIFRKRCSETWRRCIFSGRYYCTSTV